MKKILLVALASFGLVQAADTPMNALLKNPQKAQQIITNNRPVARVNGKTFSLRDVVKKMDFFLQMQYPQVFQDKVALFQYYQNNWKQQLNEMINNELILADAAEKEVEIPDGELRKEMSERFGPNVFVTLDKLNMSYEEAEELVRDDLIIRNMTWFKAYNGALQSVTPKLIKNSVTAYLRSFTQKDEWKYQVLTIRSKEEKLAAKIAKEAYALLNKGELNPHDVAAKLNSETGEDEVAFTVSASQEFLSDSTKVSEQHFSVLSSLAAGTISDPVSQTSRNGDEVKRIFCLKEHNRSEPESFDTLVESVKNQLTDVQANKARTDYIQALRKKFIFDEKEQLFFGEGDDFQPFAII